MEMEQKVEQFSIKQLKEAATAINEKKFYNEDEESIIIDLKQNKTKVAIAEALVEAVDGVKKLKGKKGFVEVDDARLKKELGGDIVTMYMELIKEDESEEEEEEGSEEEDEVEGTEVEEEEAAEEESEPEKEEKPKKKDKKEHPEEKLSKGEKREKPKTEKKEKPLKEKKEKIVKEKKESYSRGEAAGEVLARKKALTLEGLAEASDKLYAEKGGKSNLAEAKAVARFAVKITMGMGVVKQDGDKYVAV